MILVAIAQAAQAIKVNKHTLYRAAARGDVPSYRIGRAIRFDLEELRAAMREEATTRK